MLTSRCMKRLNLQFLNYSCLQIKATLLMELRALYPLATSFFIALETNVEFPE